MKLHITGSKLIRPSMSARNRGSSRMPPPSPTTVAPCGQRLHLFAVSVLDPLDGVTLFRYGLPYLLRETPRKTANDVRPCPSEFRRTPKLSSV
jgi:hypothetical protein